MQARKDANLTQAELAQRLNRRQAFISRIERGERRIDVIEFLDLARALRIDAPKFIRAFERMSTD